MNQERNAAGQKNSEPATSFNAVNYYSKLPMKQGLMSMHMLPMPIVVLDMLNIKPGSITGAGYMKLKCPSCKMPKKYKKFLFLHNVRGNFRCSNCGNRGSNILEFYIFATQASFIDAAKRLGVWQEKGGFDE